jgi:hypothetical protein
MPKVVMLSVVTPYGQRLIGKYWTGLKMKNTQLFVRRFNDEERKIYHFEAYEICHKQLIVGCSKLVRHFHPSFISKDKCYESSYSMGFTWVGSSLVCKY